VYHGRSLVIDKGYKDLDMGVHKLMKSTTYKIGNEEVNDPAVSSSQVHYTSKPLEEEGGAQKKISRRADPSNPNRKMTIGFGHGAEQGTKEDQADFRGKTYYQHYFEKKDPDLNINQAK